MYWNYRIVKYPDDGTGDEVYGVHEAYYNDKHELESLSKQSVGIVFENMKEFNTTIKKYKKAFTKPIVDYDTHKEINGEIK